MLLPFIGFLLMLAVVGGIASLIAAADPRAAKIAPVVYPAAYAGIVVFGLVLIIGFLSNFFGSDVSGLLFVIGSPVVGFGGAVLGYRAGLERREAAEAQLQLERQEEEEENL